eukprot:CAMPEP_0204127004 /NCGR_PEP_ID=MMETSP0361-20130328/11338_1 /ASSEMBLY_ACC=CAM_ASM_000343 /TAXON_ID=268821 /ORGANISM="Scrippsiella Hangoei, Strain SHTV-5" /LENGTH=479 /DNA_ID=CAMNT_0051078975 /DNA_START=53 /DNA_END=1489 /DNA_ORIENTATION=-
MWQSAPAVLDTPPQKRRCGGEPASADGQRAVAPEKKAMPEVVFDPGRRLRPDGRSHDASLEVRFFLMHRGCSDDEINDILASSTGQMRLGYDPAGRALVALASASSAPTPLRGRSKQFFGEHVRSMRGSEWSVGSKTCATGRDVFEADLLDVLASQPSQQSEPGVSLPCSNGLSVALGPSAHQAPLQRAALGSHAVVGSSGTACWAPPVASAPSAVSSPPVVAPGWAQHRASFQSAEFATSSVPGGSGAASWARPGAGVPNAATSPAASGWAPYMAPVQSAAVAAHAAPGFAGAIGWTRFGAGAPNPTSSSAVAASWPAAALAAGPAPHIAQVQDAAPWAHAAGWRLPDVSLPLAAGGHAVVALGQAPCTAPAAVANAPQAAVWAWPDNVDLDAAIAEAERKATETVELSQRSTAPFTAPSPMRVSPLLRGGCSESPSHHPPAQLVNDATPCDDDLILSAINAMSAKLMRERDERLSQS